MVSMVRIETGSKVAQPDTGDLPEPRLLLQSACIFARNFSREAVKFYRPGPAEYFQGHLDLLKVRHWPFPDYSLLTTPLSHYSPYSKLPAGG